MYIAILYLQFGIQDLVCTSILPEEHSQKVEFF